MANKTMTFGADLIPNSTTKQYNLGSSTNKWNIYGDWKGSVIPVSSGGTNATTTAAAKVNLGINVTGQDIAFWNPNGQTQHWGIGATVLASESAGVTKPSEGHRTSLVVRDDGIRRRDTKRAPCHRQHVRARKRHLARHAVRRETGRGASEHKTAGA